MASSASVPSCNSEGTIEGVHVSGLFFAWQTLGVNQVRPLSHRYVFATNALPGRKARTDCGITLQ